MTLQIEFLDFVQQVPVFVGCDSGQEFVYQIQFLTPQQNSFQVMIDSDRPLRSLGDFHHYLSTNPDTEDWYGLFVRYGYKIEYFERYFLCDED
jgi:hypothetical protein